MAMTLACRAGDSGSIPGWGVGHFRSKKGKDIYSSYALISYE